MKGVEPKQLQGEKLAEVEVEEAREQDRKQSVIECYRLAVVAGIQPMHSSFQTVSGPDGEQQYGIVSLSRPWYKQKGRVKKGSTIVLVRMHKGSRVAHLYKLMAPVNKSDRSQWHCRYLTSNLLDAY